MRRSCRKNTPVNIETENFAYCMHLGPSETYLETCQWSIDLGLKTSDVNGYSFVCLSACLFVCLALCLCRSAFLAAAQSIWLPACLPACLTVCFSVRLPVGLSSCPIRLPACLYVARVSVCLPDCLSAGHSANRLT